MYIHGIQRIRSIIYRRRIGWGGLVGRWEANKETTPRNLVYTYIATWGVGGW